VEGARDIGQKENVATFIRGRKIDRDRGGPFCRGCLAVNTNRKKGAKGTRGKGGEGEIYYWEKGPPGAHLEKVKEKLPREITAQPDSKSKEKDPTPQIR